MVRSFHGDKSHTNVTYEIVGWDQKGSKKKRIVHVNSLKTLLVMKC